MKTKFSVAVLAVFSLFAACQSEPAHGAPAREPVGTLHAVDIKAQHPKAYHPKVGDVVQCYLRFPVVPGQIVDDLKYTIQSKTNSIVSIGVVNTSKRPGGGEISAFLYVGTPGMSQVTFAPIQGHTSKPIEIRFLVTREEGGTTAKGTRNDKEKELCSGRYSAIQTPTRVFVFATGAHPTGGHQVFLEALPITVFPPEFRLSHIKPTGPVTQAWTSFSVSRSFAASKPVREVVVHDKKGAHRVKVRPLSGNPSGDGRNTGAKNIGDVVAADKSFSILTDLLAKADMTWVLKVNGPFTVLAPTDDAFLGTVPESTLEAWRKPENKETLRRVLANHVLCGRYELADLYGMRSFTTWGGRIETHPDRNAISVPDQADAAVVRKDIQASNGVIQGINRVLIPGAN